MHPDKDKIELEFYQNQLFTLIHLHFLKIDENGDLVYNYKDSLENFKVNLDNFLDSANLLSKRIDKE